MKKIIPVFLIFCLTISSVFSQDLKKLWESPPEDAKSWTFWYWMHGAVTKEGITADLEAMKEIGLGGAYLMPIRGVPEKPFLKPVVEQLSPLWWEMVDFAFKEADRLGLKIGFHICDGFALAGGPWITPELSMQKVVWSNLIIDGGKPFNGKLPQPESYKGYYRDIGIFAYPTPDGEGISTAKVKPRVTTSIPRTDAQYLADPNSKETFRSESPCWIQYEFEQPFTARSIQIQASGRNFQSQRFTIEASDDGKNFEEIVKLEPPRQGWQNDDYPMTHSIPPTTARYFRFLYDKSGTEPGSEDVDAAKWKQSLKIKHILLSSEARIHQYEGKNAESWRVSARTTAEQIPDDLCIHPEDIIDVTQYLDKNGNLNWNAPAGEWTILRIGHTSNGYTNETGGKGAGLECDKFNPDAIRLQFNSWFGKAVGVAGKERASRVLKIFHVDSWECGSQNWSANFRDEFRKRRGYDIYNYLPVMAGIAIESAETSERILYDVRQTISELVVDKFYTVLREEAHKKGCQFSAECVSPTMMSDGIMHYKKADIPMGEYWFRSPTHDKPNDVLDAISGAHIYEKNIIQAEAFTELRLTFDEHPEMLKTMQDRHYALGINRLSYHVNALNPWLDRKPGMTLDGIGLYFQRDQTWWKPGKAWIDYARRCQALLQFGRPVVDIAVFIGEELPRRAILPDRLVPFLPGIFGKEKVAWEEKRLANVGEPTREMPVDVHHSANITTSEDWVNALRGYQYDSFNPDVLLNSVQVKNGRIVLPNGMSYGALIIPGKHPMQPNPERMSEEVAKKINELSKQGAKILIGDLPDETLGLMQENRNVTFNGNRFIKLPYTDENFDKIGIQRDFIVSESGSDKYAKDIAYTHRQGDGVDIYFLSNQQDRKRDLTISLRVNGKVPELWDPVTGEISDNFSWYLRTNRTLINLSLEPNESKFIVLQKPAGSQTSNHGRVNLTGGVIPIISPWKVQFDEKSRGPKEVITFNELTDWTEHSDNRIRYYSGTAAYRNNFNANISKGKRYFINLDNVYNLAEVKVNGKPCGIIWTKPYMVEITDAIKNGENSLEIMVTNTWANRIMGDEVFNAEKDDSKKIWTNARYRLTEKKPVKSGLTGKVVITESK